MNIWYLTGAYTMLTYLPSYLCQPEHTISELMEKASKEVVETKWVPLEISLSQNVKYQHMKLSKGYCLYDFVR